MSLLALALVVAAGPKPLAQVPHFNGKFVWIKLGKVPTGSLAHAKVIALDLSIPRDVRLKKDGNGNQWFTFILADQGSDWKWHQSTGAGVLPVKGGVVKAGTYTLVIPTTGLPASVLRDRQQTVSLGPGTSGLMAPASFTVLRLRGR